MWYPARVYSHVHVESIRGHASTCLWRHLSFLESIIAAPPPKIKQNRAHGCNIGPLPSPSRDATSEKATSTLHMHTCTPRSTASHQTVLLSDIERTVPSLSISLRVATPPCYHQRIWLSTIYNDCLPMLLPSIRKKK